MIKALKEKSISPSMLISLGVLLLIINSIHLQFNPNMPHASSEAVTLVLLGLLEWAYNALGLNSKSSK